MLVAFVFKSVKKMQIIFKAIHCIKAYAVIWLKKESESYFKGDLFGSSSALGSPFSTFSVQSKIKIDRNIITIECVKIILAHWSYLLLIIVWLYCR